MKTLIAVCFLVTVAQGAAPHAGKNKARTVEISVTEDGFEPTPIKVKKGEPLKLVVTRKTDTTCATELVVPEAGLKVKLPLDKAVDVSFTPKKTGELKYGCGMEMMVSAVLLVE